jgi:hypothetical protein
MCQALAITNDSFTNPELGEEEHNYFDWKYTTVLRTSILHQPLHDRRMGLFAANMTTLMQSFNSFFLPLRRKEYLLMLHLERKLK